MRLAIICLVVVLCVSSMLKYNDVSGQQSDNLTKIIETKFPEKTISEFSPYPFSPVKVEYESPTTVLISGDLITWTFNVDLWKAMDLLKNSYGFKIQEVMTSGVGSQGNPTTVYVLMTK
jgi:hypothetical protein